MDENAVAKEVVDVAYKMHTGLGPGLLESVYEKVMEGELGRRGLRVVRQQGVPLTFDGITYEVAFRADLIVEDLVIVEVKSVSELGDVHKKQLLTYLRLSKLKLGLLINFNVPLIKDGIRRVVNGLGS